MRTRSNDRAIGSRFGAAILIACLALHATASGQETDTVGATPEESASVDEEVIVIGRSPGTLRAQIRLAEEAVYAKFNELNSDDDYDIHCRYRQSTGTRIRSRVCEPNFWRDAEAEAAEEIARRLQGGGSIDPSAFYGPARLKGELMAQEMMRLTLQNDEFRQTMQNLGGLVLAQRRERTPGSPSALIMSESFVGEGVLPYGATTMVQVRLGRRPWKYDLEQKTFALSRLRGSIEQIEVRCEDVNEVLVYETGAEWTLPEDWQECAIHIDGERETSFSFFEFE